MSYLISSEMFSLLLSIDVMSESSFFLSMKAHSLRLGLMGAGGMSCAGGKWMSRGSRFPGVPSRVVFSLQAESAR
jgi:hypothetical protein